MALKWIEGFEGYVALNDLIGPLLPLRGYVVGGGLDSIGAFECIAGHWGGFGISLKAFDQWLRTPALTTHDTLIVGFSIKVQEFRSVTDALLSVGAASTSGIILRLKSTGRFEIYRSTTSLGESSDGLIPATWAYVEIKIKCHNSSGYVEVRLNGNTVYTYNGDTDNATDGYYEWVQLNGGFSNTYANVFDDVYICDGSGTLNNDFLGVQRVVAIFPDGNGDSSQWTPSSGSNYECVDEQATSMADYVSSTTQDAIDLYTYSAVSGLTGTIHGVQVVTIAAPTVDGVRFGYKPACKTGGVVYEGSEYFASYSAGQGSLHILETNPYTDQFWSESDVNSAQFGVKLTTP